MLNFPVGYGVSGHLLGGAAVGMIVGPWRGMLSMTLVLAVQCLLFGDGGLTALGANVLNMAVLGPLLGSGAFALSRRLELGRWATGGLVACTAWLGVMAAALLCGLELAASGVPGAGEVTQALLGLHTWIALFEAAATGALAVALCAARPAMSRGGWWTSPVAGAGWVTAALAVLIPWASSRPDGLERVAGLLGFAMRAEQVWAPPLPDYSLPWAEQSFLAASLVGVLGATVVFAVAAAVARLAPRRAER
jgi:cobalt/nickel transport system permease protein